MEKSNSVHNNSVEWLSKYKDEFKPPIGNKIMFNDQLILFFVKGPNDRHDFHIEEGEEIFYMIEGEMNLVIMTNGKYENINIKEGEMYVLPPRTLHSPRRPPNSLGFAIERKRITEKEVDGLIFFDEPSSNIKHEVYGHIHDLEKQMKEIYLKARKNIDDLNFTVYQSDRPIQPRFDFQHFEKILLEKYFRDNEVLIQEKGCVNLLSDDYQSKIQVLSNCQRECLDEIYSTILWVVKGNAALKLESETVDLKVSDFYFIKSGMKITLTVPPNNLVLQIKIENQ